MLRLVESTFRNIDATKFSNFDPTILNSELANVTSATSNGFTVDTGYAVAAIAAKVPIFSSVYTTLPTATGSGSNSSATVTGTSLAPNSTAGNENAAVTFGLSSL